MFTERVVFDSQRLPVEVAGIGCTAALRNLNGLSTAKKESVYAHWEL